MLVILVLSMKLFLVLLKVLVRIMSGDGDTRNPRRTADGPKLLIMVNIRAVEPDFKKSNKKSDAQGACRRLYPTFA